MLSESSAYLLCRKPIALFRTGLESPFTHRIFTCLGVNLDEKTEFGHQKIVSPDSRPVKMILLEKWCVFNVQHDSFSKRSHLNVCEMDCHAAKRAPTRRILSKSTLMNEKNVILLEK